jgi:hypothetical protein
MPNRFSIFVVKAVGENVALDAWDLLRTQRTRVADAAAQVWVGNGPHVPKDLSVATRYGLLLEHPNGTRWALLVDKGNEDADLIAAVTWWDARPVWRTRLLAGPTITPPAGQTWPDGGTDTRANRLWRNDAATTLLRWERLIKYVKPPAWSAATAYVQGDTVMQNGIGWRCLIANTNSAPIVGNANWSPFLGLLPSGWGPASPLP